MMMFITIMETKAQFITPKFVSSDGQPFLLREFTENPPRRSRGHSKSWVTRRNSTMPRSARAVALAAALAGAHAMTIEQAPSGLRLRGGIDLGNIASSITGIFSRGAAKPEEAGEAQKSVQAELRLKGGEANFDEIRKLMEDEKLSESAIRAFKSAYDQLVAGDDGMISEKLITPASDVPVMADIKGQVVSDETAKKLLEQTVVLKLNGGLGTGMGLEKAKSLLQVGGPRTARSHLHKFMDGSDVPAARDQREGQGAGELLLVLYIYM